MKSLLISLTLGWLFFSSSATRFLLKDRDSIYGEEFRSRVKGMQLEEVIIAPHSPWQSPYVEMVIGTIRRECLDHLIILSEDHLRKVLRDFIRYYNNTRPHESLEKNSPIPRAIESDQEGPIISIPEVGGLHQHYQRAA